MLIYTNSREGNIRLLLSGLKVLESGFVPVKAEKYRAELLAIRNGDMPWEEVNKWRLDLHRKFDRSFSNTSLPEHPDYERLQDKLELSFKNSHLPNDASAKPELNNLLVHLRLLKSNF